MGSSNNPTNEDELLLSRVYNDLDVPSYKWRFKNLSKWQRSTNCTGHFRCEYNYSNFFFLLNMYYLYLCICTSAKCMSVELKVYLFIWSHNFRFSMSLSLSPSLLYRQTTDCTEGGGLTREHCMSMILKI